MVRRAQGADSSAARARSRPAPGAPAGGRDGRRASPPSGSGGARGARGPGRPRSPVLDERIVDATISRLRRGGYACLRVDDVAADAGVAKTTLYRRWPSKEALVADAVRRLFAVEVRPVDTGALRSDLFELVKESYALLDGPGRVLEDLVRESAASRELTDVVRATTDVRRRAYHEALNRAVARGDLPPTVPHDLLVDLLTGPLWTRRLVTGRPLTEADVERVVDLVLDGARRH